MNKAHIRDMKVLRACCSLSAYVIICKGGLFCRTLPAAPLLSPTQFPLPSLILHTHSHFPTPSGNPILYLLSPSPLPFHLPSAVKPPNKP